MTLFRRISSFTLVLILCLCFAASGDEATNYASYLSISDPVYDAELPQDSTVFDARFAAMLLTLSSGGSSVNTKAALQTAGFTVLRQCHYNKTDADASHTSAYTIAARKITLDDTERAVFILVVRGTNASEWYSNFDVTPSRDPEAHFSENFLYAAGDAFWDLVECAEDYDDPIFIVTGHSRGAATANLVAYLLNSSFDPSCVYAYTFACPNTIRNGTDGADAANVFNIINPADVVTCLPLSSWDFRRVGTDITLPGQTASETLVSMLSTLESIAPDITAYYNTRYLLDSPGTGEDGITPYEVMLMLAGSLSGTAAKAESASLSIDTSESDLAPLFAFMTDGTESLTAMLLQHLPSTYMTLLRVAYAN